MDSSQQLYHHQLLSSLELGPIIFSSLRARCHTVLSPSEEIAIGTPAAIVPGVPGCGQAALPLAVVPGPVGMVPRRHVSSEVGNRIQLLLLLGLTKISSLPNSGNLSCWLRRVSERLKYSLVVLVSF